MEFHDGEVGGHDGVDLHPGIGFVTDVIRTGRSKADGIVLWAGDVVAHAAIEELLLPLKIKVAPSSAAIREDVAVTGDVIRIYNPFAFAIRDGIALRQEGCSIVKQMDFGGAAVDAWVVPRIMTPAIDIETVSRYLC